MMVKLDVENFKSIERARSPSKPYLSEKTKERSKVREDDDGHDLSVRHLSSTSALAGTVVGKADGEYR
jgi:hypothetical protein